MHGSADCDDDDGCTTDSCQSGVCVFEPKITGTPCPDELFCNGLETCEGGICVAGPPPELDDGIACTQDWCDEAADVVVNAVNDANCDNGLFCDGSETCDASLGCQAGVPPAVDDAVTCTADSCDEINDVVVNTPIDANCDNGVFCDGAETCDPVLDCQAAADPRSGSPDSRPVPTSSRASLLHLPRQPRSNSHPD